MRRARFVVAYHGAPFRGSAPNRGVRTVMGDLGAAIERVLLQPSLLTPDMGGEASTMELGKAIAGEI